MFKRQAKMEKIFTSISKYLYITVGILSSIIFYTKYIVKYGFIVSACYSQGDMFIFGNNRPVADAGKDVKAISKGSIFLDGSRSYVGDGSKIKYKWIFAPGLALKNENDFSSEISFDTYGSKFLKSVETYKQVLDLKLNQNDPGTKLEVVLKIKDRIGFEDSDTLIVEYFDPKAKKKEIPFTGSTSGVRSMIDNVVKEQNLDQRLRSGILVQGISDGRVDKIDSQIISKIIEDQIKSVGFDYATYSEQDVSKKSKSGLSKSSCKTDACVSSNAKLVGSEYFITWRFANAVDELHLKIFKTQDFNKHINDAILKNPFRLMSESGLYGIDQSLRTSVSKLMSANQFKNSISIVDRLFMKNERYISYSKYPIFLGFSFLVLDKILTKEPQESKPPVPPGFPHD